MKSDVILAGQARSHSSYRCENKLSLWGMLTLNAFTGATLCNPAAGHEMKHTEYQLYAPVQIILVSYVSA